MSIFNNALSGSLAAQTALNVASQNIANVMTPGYTRQGVLLGSVVARQNGVLGGGDGVQVSSLIRFSDGYKNQQLWQSASGLARHSTSQPYLTQLEQVLGDDASGINSGLDGFFGALNAASVEPSSNPLRQQVITAAEALAQRFNSLARVLSTQRSSVAQQRTTVVGQVNTTTAGIAELNAKVALAVATGANASELIDARDGRIDELAAMVSVQVVDQPDGTRSVMLRDGQPLVIGANASAVAVHGTPDGSQTLSLDFASQTFMIAGGNLGGQLGGLHDMENGILLPLRQSIADMANEIATRFNARLAAGHTPGGAPGDLGYADPAKGPLFVFDATSSTGMLTVRSGMLGEDLAFSSSATEPGNNDNLLAMIELKNQPVTVSSLGTVLLGDAHTQLTSNLGMKSRQNQAALRTAQTVRNQATESWKSVSGVNSDEEAVNLIQYQQMYQANLKVIAVANELFDSVLSSF